MIASNYWLVPVTLHPEFVLGHERIRLSELAAQQLLAVIRPLHPHALMPFKVSKLFDCKWETAPVGKQLEQDWETVLASDQQISTDEHSSMSSCAIAYFERLLKSDVLYELLIQAQQEQFLLCNEHLKSMIDCMTSWLNRYDHIILLKSN